MPISPLQAITEDSESGDYFSYTPPTPRSNSLANHSQWPFSPSVKVAPQQPARQRAPVSFVQSPSVSSRPHPTSRMSTHRLDTSSTNFAQVLDDNGGPDGLRKLDVDYFKTVLDVFKDRKQHHSPVVFDFMLLHEINIHHLEHQLIAEWDWLSCALSQDAEQPTANNHFAVQAPRRLEEIRSLLQKYSTALRDFEDMRKRATLDERQNPLAQSSWHERLLRPASTVRGQKPHAHLHSSSERLNPFRRLSNALHVVTLSKDDPEHHERTVHIRDKTDESLTDEKSRHKRAIFGTAAPACRQLAGVEDWARERRQGELSFEAAQKAERDEKIANRFKRFSMAAFAGLGLVAPVLVMALVNKLACSLATASVATLLCALLIAQFTSISEQEIVLVTAGYAAVLVVFVGTQH